MRALQLKRREFLKLGLTELGLAGAAGSAAFSWVGRAEADASKPPAPVAMPAIAGPIVKLAPPVDFEADDVVELARGLATQPFKPISSELPDPFKSLSHEQYAAITLKPDARLWGNDKLGFVVAPMQRGFQTTNPIELNLVVDGKAYKLAYSTEMFDFGKLKPSPAIGDIGFAGFEVLVPQGKSGERELATFQGANFFRALADGQVAGLMARALALKVADPKGEETPLFRTIWIEKPSVVENLILVHALIDSESLAGAFRFTIRPGDATIIDTECTLVPRAKVDNFGLASMSATHLLGFLDHKRFDDYRPNVAEVGGVQMLTGANEWVWRPVTNRETLQISTFVDAKPRGFGLLLRDRDFENYDDEIEHWEKRPSLWIEPIGDWDEGGVQLIEIPSQSDANDNILCFWRPKAPLQAGVEAAFAYRQFWCWGPAQQAGSRPHDPLALGRGGQPPAFLCRLRGRHPDRRHQDRRTHPDVDRRRRLHHDDADIR